MNICVTSVAESCTSELGETDELSLLRNFTPVIVNSSKVLIILTWSVAKICCLLSFKLSS